MRPLVAFGLLALAGCTQPTGTAGEAPPPSSAAENVAAAPPDQESHAKGLPIATVLTHDSKVTILSQGGDINVVVRKGDGAIVADGISLEQLRKTDPHLHAIVSSSYASNGGGTYLDATLMAR